MFGALRARGARQGPPTATTIPAIDKTGTTDAPVHRRRRRRLLILPIAVFALAATAIAYSMGSQSRALRGPCDDHPASDASTDAAEPTDARAAFATVIWGKTGGHGHGNRARDVCTSAATVLRFHKQIPYLVFHDGRVDTGTVAALRACGLVPRVIPRTARDAILGAARAARQNAHTAESMLA